MGTVYPPLESLTEKHQPPTEGELLLLKAFQQYLPGDCEIFFQPYLNGDRPDIVILRKGYGAHIVEVKDWNLDYYNVDNQGNWCLTKDKTESNPQFLKYNATRTIFTACMSRVYLKRR
ncbi:MAG: NERD domain-containing protein [Candidatus Cloacimonetes bacterium]|nr:NERD domain-containing protein [Candidatus Cloacimonadota bacterium]